MSYKSEIKRSLDFLGNDPKVLFIGYGLGKGTNKGAGFLKDINENQIIETPVAENLMLSMSIGLSLEGFLPVVVYERFDFILNAMDALVNHLDKIYKISSGEFRPKVIIRCIIGGKKNPFFSGPTHTQDFTKAISMMVKMPVIKLINPGDIFNVYRQAYESEDSTIIVEEKDLYDSA